MSYASDLKKRLHQQIKRNGTPAAPPSLPKPARGPEELNRLKLLVQEGCPSCAAVEEYLQEEIQSGQIAVCNLKTRECTELADKLNIQDTPAVVMDTVEGPKRCELESEGDDFIVSCPFSEPVKTAVEPPSEQAAEPPAIETPTPPTEFIRRPAITCLSTEVKQIMGYQLQAKGASSSDIMQLSALPECAADPETNMPVLIGWGTPKHGTKNAPTKSSKYSEYVSKCMRRPELAGMLNKDKIRRCAEIYREEKAKLEKN